MTKTGAWTIILGILYTLVISFVFYQIGTLYPRESAVVQSEAQDSQTSLHTPLPTQAPPVETPGKIVYTVKEYNSRIGVYENGELIRIVDVDVTSLRAQDAQKLKDGIEANSKEEVAQILEDYSS